MLLNKRSRGGWIWRRLAFAISFALLGVILCDRPGQAAGATSVDPPVPPSDRAALNKPGAKPTELATAEPSVAGTGEIEQLRREIQAERKRTEALEKRLDELQTNEESRLGELEKKQKSEQNTVESLGRRVLKQVLVGRGKERTPDAQRGLTQADVYKNGFYVSTEDERFSLRVNLLDQNRYTFFKPHDVTTEGASDNSENNFDVFLARLALSGSVFDSDLKYFAQFETITAGGSNGTHLLDWFASYTFNPYLTLQMGRFWSLYTYEYHNSPAFYTFPDLSTAEYAFLLQRIIGVAAYGQISKLGYWAAVGNPVPALDVSQQSNYTSRVAVEGSFHYDLIGPYYGDIETIPNAAQPLSLTLWAGGMTTPVAKGQDSSFENITAGDRLIGATSSMLFRWNYLSFRGTGYYRRTKRDPLPDYDSWGWNETGSYVFLPPHWEIAERVSEVYWGAEDFTASGFPVTNWFSNPNLPTHRISEFSLGLNYYLYGHNAKVQAWYSVLDGSTFEARSFGANRFILQTQLMF